jgi:predicted SpoU family rRNA methylase
MIILVSFAGLYKVKTLNIIIKKLIVKQDSLKLNLDKFNQEGIKVKVTMYQPTFPQTDDTPDITADGTKFQIDKASNYRYVALSRNLLHRWGGPFNYGDFIQIKGTAHKDGVYQVKDTMNPKWVNVVDILESLHIKPYKYENVNLFKTTWTTN